MCSVGVKMNLKLYAVRNGNRNQPTERRVQLVVIDLDKSPKYPLNFVCVFPKYFRFIEKRSSQFVNIFGSKSMHVAKKLLSEASVAEKDPEIRQVIKKRTHLLVNKRNTKTLYVYNRSFNS